MKSPLSLPGKWTERSGATGAAPSDAPSLFDLLFERSAEAIWLLDPDNVVFVACNQAAVKLMRAHDAAQLVGVRPDQLSPPLQPDGQSSSAKAAALNALTDRVGTHCFEWVARRCDGTEIPLEVMVTPLSAEGRRLNVVVARDISARKRAQDEILELNQSLERRIQERTAELRASEARWRTLVDHAPEAIVVFSGWTGRFVSCNANATRFYGLTAEQLAQLTPAEVSPEFQPDGRPSKIAVEEKVREALSGATPVFEWLHRHADGHPLPCEVRLVRLPGEGEPLIRASVIDSRERQRREKIQRATFEISEAVHTAADLPSLYREIHTIVAGLMPAQNFYIALLEPRSQMIEFAYHVDERTERPPPLPMNTGLTSVVLRTGKPLLVDHAMLARKLQLDRKVTFQGVEDATYFESGVPAAVWLGVPLLLRGRAIGVVAVQDYGNEQAYCENDKQILTFVARQIALAIERKRAEAELLRTLAREKELGQLKSTFVSMVSHEFRTPLGIIQSSAEILHDYFSQLESPQREEQLQSIVKNTQRMAGMMEEILVLSRLDSGKMEFKPARLDLAGFCHRLVEQVLSATARRCPIELRLATFPAEAQADERLLDYIFSNLLGNAVKYSPAGSPVQFTVDRDGPHAVCRICDQGIGIPVADQPWLFNAFHRGANVGERSGSGLGLVLVKRCVELHRGEVQIESTVGEGTRVTLRLPLFAIS